MISPTQLDPSRTSLLRRSFTADMRQRHKRIRDAITQLVVTDDVFGLKESTNAFDGLIPAHTFVSNTRWRFFTDSAKLTSFLAWFSDLLDREILEGTSDSPWTDKYVHPAYTRGARRAFSGVRGKASERLGALRDAFTQPISVDKLKLLSTRAFHQLRGITQAMSQEISRVLANGLVAGSNPNKIARDLRKVVTNIEKKRSIAIARTEIIHANSEGQLDALEELGIDEVTAIVEWLTAANPCPKCAPLKGIVLTIQKARGLIPRHPGCKCAWIPAAVTDEGSITSRSQIARRLKKSIIAETNADSAREAKRKSTWVGADLKP